MTTETELEELESITPKKKSGTALRVATVVPLIPLILLMMFTFRPGWFQAFVLTAVTLSGYELMRMKVLHSRGMRIWGAFATLLFAASMVYLGTKGGLITALIVVTVGALVCSLLRPDPIEDASGRVAWMIGGPIYVGAGLGSILLLHAFPQGGGWVLLAMAIAWGSDTCAYFVGRKYGKTKLYPRVSPKKTIEGSLGGIGGSVLFAALISIWLPNLRTLDAMALGVVAGTIGQGGDLLVSLLKRSSGVKDSGGILPGHGGLLDRVDALMFVSLVTWAYAHHIAFAM